MDSLKQRSPLTRLTLDAMARSYRLGLFSRQVAKHWMQWKLPSIRLKMIPRALGVSGALAFTQ
jgi:hypothetical protein